MEPICLGDTSLRRAGVIEAYSEICRVVSEQRGHETWSANNVLQAWFYDALIENTAVFHEVERPAVKKRAQRARTYTNALVKAGLLDIERHLTPLGSALVADDLDLDQFEELATLKPGNAVLFRGLLNHGFKLDDGTLYYPLRALLFALASFDGELSYEQFVRIFMVDSAMTAFDDEVFVSSLRDSGEEDAQSALSEEEQVFVGSGVVSGSVFPHGKGKTYQKKYIEFVSALMSFRAEPSFESYQELYRTKANKTVRDGFLIKEYFPRFGKPDKVDLDKFVSEITFPGFASDDDEVFRQAILSVFRNGKSLALAKEYFDLNRRLVAATGLFSFEGRQVRVRNSFVLESLSLIQDFRVVSQANVISSNSFPTFVDLYGVETVRKAFTQLEEKWGIEPTEVDEWLRQQRQAEFERVINEVLPPSTVNALLSDISQSYGTPALETRIQRAFASKPTVPTAFEYLVGLSIYYASPTKFDFSKSLNMSLDADFMPLSPAPGFRGDIEIVLPEAAVLVEVTLMNPSNQRRNELEPVLRHATNFEAEFGDGRKVSTFFIANEIDVNVETVLSFARLMPLRPTLEVGETGQTYSPVVVAFNTNEWLSLMDAESNFSNVIDYAYSTAELSIDDLRTDWRRRAFQALPKASD